MNELCTFPALDGITIGLDEAGTELDFQNGSTSGLGLNESRPWTELVPALDGNIIGLGRGRDGARFPERKYFRPWTELIPALGGINFGLGRN